MRSKIDCERYEELLNEARVKLQAAGDHLHVYSGLTDFSGQFGEPRVETIWADPEDDSRPWLSSTRYPNADGTGIGEDARPCEHYLYSEPAE